MQAKNLTLQSGKGTLSMFVGVCDSSYCNLYNLYPNTWKAGTSVCYLHSHMYVELKM